MYSSTGVTIAMFPVILGLNSYETHPTQPQSLYRKSAKHSCQTREPWNVSKRHVLWSIAWRGVSTTELNPVILAPFQQTSDCLVAIKFGPKHAANVAYWRSTGNLTLFIGGFTSGKFSSRQTRLPNVHTLNTSESNGSVIQGVGGGGWLVGCGVRGAGNSGGWV